MGVERGCLVLADISGYTSYLAGVELEHSHDVLADLLDTIVRTAEGVLSLSKLEADAGRFAYIEAQEAVRSVSVDLSAAAGVVWSYLTDPAKRPLWTNGVNASSRRTRRGSRASERGTTGPVAHPRAC